MLQPAADDALSRARRSRGARAIRWRSSCSTVPSGNRDPGAPASLELALGGGGLRAVQEEPVDGRSGPADVGAEGAELEQPLRERRRRRGRSAAGCRGRAGARPAASASRRRVAPLLEAGRAVARGRRRRRRRPSTASRGRAAAAATTQKSCGRSSGASSRPVPAPSCGPEVRKNGTSAPSSAASSCRRSGGSGSGSVSLASRSAVAASELPPPRPAATGIVLPDPRVPARLDARGLGELRRARARTIVSSAKPSTASSAAGSSATRSQRSIRWRTVATSCWPSSRSGPTTSARLIFAVAGARFTRRSASARATNSGGASSSARTSGSRPISRERRRRCARASRGRRARASSRASSAGARTRPSTSCFTRAKSGGSSRRRKATSAESTFGRGRKTVRETGWKPVRSAASWTSTETAP